MKIKLPFTLVFALSLMMCFNSFAQTSKSNSWKLLKSENGIEVYSQIVSCQVAGFTISPDYLIFKTVNTTSSSHTIKLKYEIYFEEGCSGCNNDLENTLEVTLEAGRSTESSCENFEGNFSTLISNPNFEGSWTYTNSKVQIQVIK